MNSLRPLICMRHTELMVQLLQFQKDCKVVKVFKADHSQKAKVSNVLEAFYVAMQDFYPI